MGNKKSYTHTRAHTHRVTNRELTGLKIASHKVNEVNQNYAIYLDFEVFRNNVPHIA